MKEPLFSLQNSSMIPQISSLIFSGATSPSRTCLRQEVPTIPTASHTKFSEMLNSVDRKFPFSKLFTGFTCSNRVVNCHHNLNYLKFIQIIMVLSKTTSACQRISNKRSRIIQKLLTLKFQKYSLKMVHHFYRFSFQI